MKSSSRLHSGKALSSLLLLTAALSLPAATVRYVNINNTNPVPPFTDWSTAATNIQEAVDAAEPGDEILVNNGVYATGGRAVNGTMTNRVAVTKAVTVRSVNGPSETHIVGYQVPGTRNGPAAVRCVFLTNGALLAGFTLTNGATQTSANSYTNQSGGGVWSEGFSAVLSNCVLTGNSAYSQGAGAFGGTLNNCVLTSNSTSAYGGGAYAGTFNNCVFTGNSASFGGGAYTGTLNKCSLTGNSATYGGGAYGGTLNNCALMGNSASRFGGGVDGSRANNCTLTGNSADDGGGAYGGTLNNCTLTGNSAKSGGGAYEGKLSNCTLTGNSANRVGGAMYGTLNNCIVHNNSARYADTNYFGATFNYCCTTPLPPGPGNLAEDPQLAGTWRLSAGSPCIGRGSAAYASGEDLDSEPWANPPSIGCDEYWCGSLTGALNVAIVAAYTNVAVGFGVDFQAVIGGQVSSSRWDFGDGSVASNRPWASHAWAAAGDYVVELRACNESNPAGVAATVTVRVVPQPTHYVALTSANPLQPYSSWAAAARNIQDAVDVATVPGALVWVSNGVYQIGVREVYRMTNRVAVTKPVTVRSVNGPPVTQILGYQEPGTRTGPTAVRCVYLTNGAVLAGFTLTNGATQNSDYYGSPGAGGGVWSEGWNVVVSNCVLTGNSAIKGGGVFLGTLHNCVLTDNSADQEGGGAYFGTLNNCTLAGNIARSYAGGAEWSSMNNCIIYYNSAPNGPNCYGGTFKYCCSTPLPADGGNLTNAPLFMNTNGWSNLRLQSNSPCINAGDNASVSGTTDLDGKPHIVGGAVDIGAYEFQSPASQLSYAWLQQYGLPTDGSADFTDPDGDHANNWQEWNCATVPTNALSALRLLTPQTVGSNLVVTWQSVTNKTYFLERSTSLATNASFLPLASNIAGQTGTTTFTDTNAAPAGPRFYRVGVQ